MHRGERESIRTLELRFAEHSQCGSALASTFHSFYSLTGTGTTTRFTFSTFYFVGMTFEPNAWR